MARARVDLAALKQCLKCAGDDVVASELRTMASSAASASQAAAPLAEVLASFSEAIACSDDEGALDGTNGLTAQNGDLSREKRIR